MANFRRLLLSSDSSAVTIRYAGGPMPGNPPTLQRHPFLTRKRTTLFLYMGKRVVARTAQPTKKFPQCTGISADFLNLAAVCRIRLIYKL
jgi:hypothetical protein